jgi:Cof subfamily protein (haloacid dehalogenase superfamily)
MPHYRLLALDIDGTLVNSEHALTDPTREAVLRAKQAGMEVVLATGRRYSRTLPLVEPLHLHLPLITASGALIKDPFDHRTLFVAEFAPGALEDCLTIVDRVGYAPVLYGDSFGEGFDYYCAGVDVPQPELAEFLQLNLGSERRWPDLVARPPAGVFACFAMGTRDEMLSLETELTTRMGEHLSVHVLRSPRYRGFMCEIAPAGVSKWSGIRHLADQWGIAAEEICAVGDDVNDIPMIEGAGLGIAMGNAVEPVKAAADRVAPCNNSNGLVEVVRWLLDEAS